MGRNGPIKWPNVKEMCTNVVACNTGRQTIQCHAQIVESVFGMNSITKLWCDIFVDYLLDQVSSIAVS